MRQGQRDLADRLTVPLIDALTIAEIERSGLTLLAAPLPGNGAHGRDDIFHLPAVGPSVHEDGTADAAGDAAGELEPREPGVRRGCRDVFEQRPGADDDTFPLHADGGHRVIELHDRPADASIEHEDVRAVAEDRQRDLVARDESQDVRRLLHVSGEYQVVGIAADLERRMLLHGLVQQHLLRLQEAMQVLHKGFIDLTHVHPPQICRPGPSSASRRNPCCRRAS